MKNILIIGLVFITIPLLGRTKKSSRFIKRQRVEPTKNLSDAQKSKIYKYKGHKYKYFFEKISWSEAKKKCEDMGGILAILDTKEELEYIQNQRPCRFTAWVGITDEKNEGQWVWLNGKQIKNEMTGFLEKANSLDIRDYGHILLQGGLMSRANKGNLPKGWRGQALVQAFLCEWN